MHIDCSGLLFVGDPHLTSRRPGFRLDSDFGQTILGKLQYCIDYANLNDCALLITGDLFDREQEKELTLLSPLIRMFHNAIHPVIVLAGNHDLKASEVQDRSSISLIEASQCAVVLHGNELSPIVFNIDGLSVGLGYTAHQLPIPKKVQKQTDKLIWMTHHNLAFPKVDFPGCDPLHEIDGVDLVVNGHIHKTLPEVQKGQTCWMNIGNIARLSLDVRDHVPKAYHWTPSKSDYVVVPHQKAHESFDLTTVSSKLLNAQLSDQKKSEFVELLSSEGLLQNDTSGDGGVLKDELENILTIQSSSDTVKKIIYGLFNQVTEE